MDSYTVAENTNSYNVTGLSDIDNYNVTITAVGVCGMITSDPVTIYGEYASMYIHVRTYMYNVSLYLLWWIYVCSTHIHKTVCKHHLLSVTFVKCTG